MKKIMCFVVAAMLVSLPAVAGWYAVPSPTGDVVLQSGDTPYPNGAVEGLSAEVTSAPERYKFSDGVIVLRSAEELAQIEAAKESAKQLAKPVELKAVENAYMWLCVQISGQPEKLSIPQLLASGMQMASTNYPRYKAFKDGVEMVNQSAIRSAGLQWWDDCSVHPEISEEANSFISLIKLDLAHAGE